jgi:hypothetical protein
MARERKKARKVSINEIYDLFIRLSDAYDARGDVQRRGAFLLAGETIKNLKEITCGADIAKLKGCGKASVEVVDEFIKTGRCTRLEELQGDEAHLDYEEIIDLRMAKRTKELEAMDAPQDAEDAKAFVIIGHKYCKSREKEAKAILKSMDDNLKVILAEMLKKEGYAISNRAYRNDDSVCMCECCNLTLYEQDVEECVCTKLELQYDALAIGCADLPSVEDYEPFEG